MSNADEIPKESKWGNDAHSALCVALAEALIAAGSSPAQKKDLIMAVMKACGQLGFTWESVRQHLQKLRRKEGVSAAVASDSGANTSTPTKGRKRAAPGSGVKKTPGTGRGKKAAAAKTAPLVINSDDEDDIKESPEKKLKTEESKVKEEYDDGVDDYMYPNEI